MNIRYAIVIACAVLFAAPAIAGQKDCVRVLAEHSGLSEVQVRMVLNGRTAYHNRFPLYFDRVEKQLVGSIGKDNYSRLTNGESITLTRQLPSDTAIADRGER